MPVPKERLVVQLRTLMDLSATVNSTLDASEIQRRAVESAAIIVDAERSSLLILDPDTSDLCFEYRQAQTGETVRQVRLPRGRGVAGWVVKNRSSAIVPDVGNDSRYVPGVEEETPYVTRDMLCVPVFSRGQVIGALQAMNKRGRPFDEDDRQLMEALAHHVAVAIENANLYQGIKDAFFQTAEVLADTVERADPCTGEHVRRVMEYSLEVCAELGLDPVETENVRLSAVLHDIGKVGVPDEVLRKPDDLDTGELELMRGHSTTGSDLLRKVSHLHPVMDAVRSHHERVDGRGYPDGLRGDEIPMGARIIAVVDAYDAMTNDRPYRKAMTRKRAIAELRQCSGTQFDGAVTAAFIRVLESRPRSTRVSGGFAARAESAG